MRTIARLLLLPAVVAAAAPAAYGGEDPAIRDAQARFEEGLDRVKAGDYEAARISFAQAYAVLKRPAILWNLALAEEKTGRAGEAATHFKRVARDPTATAADREEAARHAAALASQTGHLDATAPAGATFRVDGGDPLEAVAPLAEPIDVTPGHHVVEAAWRDSRKVVAVDVLPGELVHVDFGGGAAPASPNAPQTLAATGGATNGTVAAEHGIPTARIATTAGLGGAAVAAIVAGVVLGAESRSKANEAASDRSALGGSAAAGACAGPSPQTGCSGLAAAVRAENRDAAVSTAMYATGGVLAAGAIVTWFVWPKTTAESSRAAWWAPVVGPNGVGLRAGGRF